jgi:hypothetical protein
MTLISKLVDGKCGGQIITILDLSHASHIIPTKKCQQVQISEHLQNLPFWYRAMSVGFMNASAVFQGDINGYLIPDIMYFMVCNLPPKVPCPLYKEKKEVLV